MYFSWRSDAAFVFRLISTAIFSAVVASPHRLIDITWKWWINLSFSVCDSYCYIPSLYFAQLYIVNAQEVVHFRQSQIDRWTTSLKIKRAVEMGRHKDAHIVYPQRISVIHCMQSGRIKGVSPSYAHVDKYLNS